MKFSEQSNNGFNSNKAPRKLSIKALLEQMKSDDDDEKCEISITPIQPQENFINTNFCDAKSILSSVKSTDNFISIIRGFDKKNILSNFDWQKIIINVKLKIFLAFIVVIGVTSGVALYTKQIWDDKVKFTASSKILYQSVKDKGRQILGKATSIKMISSKKVLTKLANSNGVDLSPSQLSGMLKVNLDSKTNLVSITFSDQSPQRAVSLANKLSDIATESNKQYYTAAFHTKYQNLMKQVSLTEKFLNVQERKVIEFMGKSGIYNIREAYRSFMDGISLQQRSYLEAQMTLEKYKIELQVMEKEYLRMPDEVVRNAYEDNPLKGRLTNSKMALLDAQITYGEDNPNVKSIQDSIKRLQEQLASQDVKSTLQKVYMPNQRKISFGLDILMKKAEIDAQTKRMQSIKLDLDKRQVGLKSVPEKQLVLEGQIRRKVALEELLESLRDKANSAEISMKSETCDLSKYEEAFSAKQINPTSILIYPIGTFVLSFIGLFTFIGILELKDPKLRTKKQLGIFFESPCAAVIPKGDVEQDRAVKDITSFIKLYKTKNVPKSIAFCSSNKGEGKSLLSHKMANYFSRLGLKTILIKFDEGELSEGQLSLQEYLELDQLDGEVIQDGESFDQISTKRSEALEDLIKTRKFEGLWARLKTDYDMMILDLPGVNEVNYSLKLLDKCDFNLFVVNSQKTGVPQVKKAINSMEREFCQPNGFVLNKVSKKYMKVNL